MAGQHFIHYLPRRVNGRSARSEVLRPDDPSFKSLWAPMEHGTEAPSGAAYRVRCGDTIWIASVVRSPWGVLAPSLDAKIVVGTPAERISPVGLKFPANRSCSEWIPLRDGTAILHQLETIDARGNTSDLLPANPKNIGQYLQSMRQLLNPEVLEAWLCDTKCRGYTFLSYRVVDGTQSALNAAKSLMAEGKAVFWDRWSLPRRLAENREQVPDKSLQAYLEDRIGNAREFAAVWSPKYGEEGSYSLQEINIAEDLKKFSWFRQGPPTPNERTEP